MVMEVLCITDGKWGDDPDTVYAWPKDEWMKWWIFRNDFEGDYIAFEMPLWKRWKYDRVARQPVCITPMYEW